MPMKVLTRREVLRLCAAGSAFFLPGPGDFRMPGLSSEVQNLVSAVSAVDHLLLGVADLDKGIDWVGKRTGVRAVLGGSHPGVGTRNALLSLGGRRYLEIVAPDPAQTAYNARTDVRKLVEPRLIGWAAVTLDIEGLAKKVRDAGQQIYGPRDGSRARPDGTTLRWKTLGILTQLMQDGVDPVPFFIEWAADSVHPSQDSSKGCELQSFDLEAPNPSAVADALKAIGIDVTVSQERTTSLRATLVTGKGRVELR
jgi:Glyoxalase-like domain